MHQPLNDLQNPASDKNAILFYKIISALKMDISLLGCKTTTHYFFPFQKTVALRHDSTCA